MCTRGDWPCLCLGAHCGLSWCKLAALHIVWVPSSHSHSPQRPLFQPNGLTSLFLRRTSDFDCSCRLSFKFWCGCDQSSTSCWLPYWVLFAGSFSWWRCWSLSSWNMSRGLFWNTICACLEGWYDQCSYRMNCWADLGLAWGGLLSWVGFEICWRRRGSLFCIRCLCWWLIYRCLHSSRWFAFPCWAWLPSWLRYRHLVLLFTATSHISQLTVS